MIYLIQEEESSIGFHPPPHHIADATHTVPQLPSEEISVISLKERPHSSRLRNMANCLAS